jgi:hypothetical protein
MVELGPTAIPASVESRAKNRQRVRAKRFAVLVRPKDVRLIPLMRWRWQAGSGPAAAGMVPWPPVAALVARRRPG